MGPLSFEPENRKVLAKNGDSCDFPKSTDHTQNPTHLLHVAIKKRRSLANEKDQDMRKRLLIGVTIQNLCKYIGEQRAARKRKQFSEFYSSSESDLLDLGLQRPKFPKLSSDGSEVPSKPLSVSQELNRSDQSLSVIVPKHFQKKRKYECSNHLDLSESRTVPDVDVKIPRRENRAEIVEDDPFGLNEFFESLKSAKVR